MKDLSKKERNAFIEQFFGNESAYQTPSVNVTNRIDLMRALHKTGLVPLLLKNGMLFTPYDQWLRWYDMYQQLSEGKSRKNGAKDMVYRFFEQYYSEHPEVDAHISFEKFERMQKFVKKPLVK